MDTDKKIREHISALADGELPAADLELALAALQSTDGQQAWNTYFRIGDELRATETPALSDGFAEKLAARLAAEPAPMPEAGMSVANVAEPGPAAGSSTSAQGSNAIVNAS